MMQKNTLHLMAHNAADRQQAQQLLAAGGLVAIPTETVYGLAADASNPQAVAGIFAAKGRPADHPLIVHLGHIEQLSQWAQLVPDSALQLAKAFWPGPLTLLLPKAAAVNSVVTGGLNSIGLRMPSHPLTLQLLQDSGVCVAAPSANPYKQLSPTCAEQVLQSLGGKIDAVLDGGDCEVGLESTIVDLTCQPPRILRAGPISAAQLTAVLGQEIAPYRPHAKVVPGNVKTHYQPRTPLRLICADELTSVAQQHNGAIATLAYSQLWLLQQRELSQVQASITLAADKAAYAQALYKSLYLLDKEKLDLILVELPPQDDEWLDVNDRLSRAQS